MAQDKKYDLEVVELEVVEEEEVSQYEDLDEAEDEEEILGGGSTLSRGETTEDSGEKQEGLQRDNEPDDYDDTTDQNASDDRVRGAGQQSLAELTIARGQGKGLAEHVGGIRHDRPEPNVNDPDPAEEEEEITA